MPPPEPNATLRPFRAEDYPALHALRRRIDPGFSAGVADMESYDARRRDEAHARLVLDRAGEVVAAAEYRVRHAQLRHFDLALLLPEEERSELDRLYLAVVGLVAGERPAALFCYLREDRGWLRTELERRGYREHERHTVSHLDLTAFDATRVAEGAARLAALGLHPTDYAAADPTSVATQRKLYDLDIAVVADIPWTVPLDLWSFETWQERFPGPSLLDDGILIAETDTGAWVGLTMLMASDRPGQLQTGLTGVLAPWRGRGVASALKLAGIGYALARGATRIVTRNHSVNRGMLGINERLGFVADPTWLTLRLDLGPGASA